MTGTWVLIALQNGIPADPITVFSETPDGFKQAKKELIGRAEAHKALVGANGLVASNGRGFQLWLVRAGGVDHRYSRYEGEENDG